MTAPVVVQNSTPMMIENVLIFLSARVMREQKNTKLIEVSSRNCTVSLASEVTAIFSLCSRVILN